MKHLPNVITFLRLLGIPVLLVLLYTGEQPIDYTCAAVFFVILAVTDILDGWLARKLEAVSAFGKLMDPLVDKLLVVAPLIALVGFRSEVHGDPWVPAFLVILLIAREFWVTGLRGLAATRGNIVAANELGKIKTVFQVCAVFFLILHDQKIFRFGDNWYNGYYLGVQFLAASIVVAYWGAIEYTIMVFKAKPKEEGRVSRMLSKRAHL